MPFKMSLVRESLKFLMIVLLAASLQACMQDANGEGDTPEEAEEASPAIPVEAAMVDTGDVSAVYSGTTTLEADVHASVVAKTTGVVLEILAEEGDYVERGQVLVRLDTDRYRLEVARARAALNRLSTDYDRKKELFDRKLVSAEAFEQVKSDYEAQKAAYDLAQLDLQYAEIKAPIAGFVSERHVRIGNLITLHSPVFNITSYQPLLAVLHVPEQELSVLRLGLPVDLSVDAWPGEDFSGTITRLSPVIDPATGTFKVTAEVSDQAGRLKPGLFGRVRILYDTREYVPVVPREAIVMEDDQNHVFVINEDSNVERRDVMLGYEGDGVIEVIQGLQPGEQVVTAGKGSLSDGAEVEVIQVEAVESNA